MSNFTSPLVPITLERQDPSQPWGFRLQGGADYRLALSVKKVSQGTPAHQKLHPGDVIVAIQGQDVTSAPHAICNELIAGSGLTCQFTVRKGQYNVPKQTRPAVKFTQTGQTILPAQNAYRRNH